MTTDRAHWTKVAQQWITWARSPGHDAFWAYREALLDFIGPGVGSAIEIGCGEGRVSRVLKQLGYRVTATDPVAAMVEASQEVDSADDYAICGANSLPFDTGNFDLAMAYNVLMDIDDIHAALREIRRVMKPDGTLFVSLVHPFRDRGRFDGPQPDATFMMEDSYYGRRRFDGEEKLNDLRMHFAGWSQPLQNYMAAFEQEKLAIVSLREPVPSPAHAERFAQSTRMPLFLWLKLRLLP
jgi:SAM-dependent methyltransferase